MKDSESEQLKKEIAALKKEREAEKAASKKEDTEPAEESKVKDTPKEQNPALEILWDFREEGPKREEFSKEETDQFFTYLFGDEWDKNLKLTSRVSGSFTKPNSKQTLYYVSACETEYESGILSSQCPHALWDTTGWIAIYEDSTPVVKIKAALGNKIVKTTDVNGDGVNEIISLNTYSNQGYTRNGGALGQISGDTYKEIKILPGSSDSCALPDPSDCVAVTSVVKYVPTTNGEFPDFVEEYFRGGSEDSDWKKVTKAQFEKDSVN
jgi:hypothetical protein